MKIDPRLLRFVGVSVAVHILLLGPLALFHIAANMEDTKLAIETLFAEERPVEEFTKELSIDTQISQTISAVAGGAVTAAVAGGSASSTPTAQTRVDTSDQLKDPEVVVNVGDFDLPGEKMLGEDLGEAEVNGEVSAAVEGYGPAMSRLAQEILRMMREQKVLVVWLFDQSESMADDQKEIREQFLKIYEELKIAQEKDQKLNADREILLTAVHQYGEKMSAITSKPTAKASEVKAAIDKIQIDPSGKENMFAALNGVIDQYRTLAQRSRRKLVIIFVTDESGDDGETPAFEEALAKCKKAKAPVYILGRESVFGYPYAHVTWRDPDGLTHWLRINRGPESCRPEALQYNGLEHRWDAYSAGFGPYEQARLCRDTGGIFFILPNEEETVVGKEAAEKRKFAFLDLKEYQPDLGTRRAYDELRAKSKFRTGIADVIKTLNPFTDSQLSVRVRHFLTTKDDFAQQVVAERDKAKRAMMLLQQAARLLEKIRPERDSEASQRWRANYDLAYAQVLAYRVRLFQYMLLLDRHVRNFQPPPKDPNVSEDRQANQWWVGWTPTLIEPTDEQIKLTGVDIEELRSEEKRAREMFQQVIRNHPRTPWANRAETELAQGFGMRLYPVFWDPRYNNRNIKVPTY